MMSDSLLKQGKWRYIDQSVIGLNHNPLFSFGMDDCLCASVGSGLAPATARSWVHRQTVVLGIQDTKLPYIQDGLSYLEEQGFQYIVRNSGGLAVVLDEGIFNLSLVFPEGGRKIDIDSGYQAMYTLIKEMFKEENKEIEAREIVGSYCPGSFDLSINGKKFAGISQRRIRHGVAVQIYLCVAGQGSTRAQLIKDFYSVSRRNIETKFAYPEINIEVMASLSELFQKEITINQVIFRLLQVLRAKSDHLFSSTLNDEEWPIFEYYHQRVVERNQQFMKELNR